MWPRHSVNIRGKLWSFSLCHPSWASDPPCTEQHQANAVSFLTSGFLACKAADPKMGFAHIKWNDNNLPRTWNMLEPSRHCTTPPPPPPPTAPYPRTAAWSLVQCGSALLPSWGRKLRTLKPGQVYPPAGTTLGMGHSSLKAQLGIICISYREQMLISIKKCSHTALASLQIPSRAGLATRN